jgi:hypothetical protein
MITPTIGRVLWFWLNREKQSQPFDSHVCFVNDDGTVNLAYHDALGNLETALSVKLLQDSDEPSNGPEAEWMPYQKEQAAKAAPEPTP